MKIKADIAEGTGAGQPADGKRDFLAGGTRLGEDLAQIAADHQPDERIRIEFRGRPRGNVAAVAEDRHRSAMAKHFVHFVRDIDDRHAALFQYANRGEERFRLAVRQGAPSVHP